MNRTDFPSNFVWGTATAAFQIEGATTEDGRGRSIWDTFTERPGAIIDGRTAEVASDHYHRAAEDIALMDDLGLTGYRFSIAWSRIQPTVTGKANRAGIDFYRRVAEGLLERGIAPWATLYHWDLPQTLEDNGGWLERDTALRFAEYSAVVADELGDVISHWITLNEPWCSTFLGYAAGYHAPGRSLGTESSHAAHHLLLGHGLAVQTIREIQPEAEVGIALNLYSVQPASDSQADVDAARRIDGLCNRFFLEPVLAGNYPADVLADMGETAWFDANAPQADLELISAPIDFLGVNYYRWAGRRAREGSRVCAEPAPVCDRERCGVRGYGLGRRERRRRRAPRVSAQPHRGVRCCDRAWNPPRGVLPLVSHRQLRVGVGIHAPFRDRLRGLRNPGTHPESKRAVAPEVPSQPSGKIWEDGQCISRVS